MVTWRFGFKPLPGCKRRGVRAELDPKIETGHSQVMGQLRLTTSQTHEVSVRRAKLRAEPVVDTAFETRA